MNDKGGDGVQLIVRGLMKLTILLFTWIIVFSFTTQKIFALGLIEDASMDMSSIPEPLFIMFSGSVCIYLARLGRDIQRRRGADEAS